MKTILFYCILLFSGLVANSAWGQGCTCQPTAYLTQDPANPCCYFLNLDFTSAQGCGALTNFNQISVNTNIFGGTAVITGATGSGPFTATNSATLATFSTAPGFIPAAPQNYVVGQICFSNTSAAFFPALMTLSNSNIPVDPCALTFFQDDMTTSCQPPCPCKPVVHLTPNPNDPCCYLLDMTIANLAGCTNLTFFDQITLSTGGTGLITGATGSAPFSATVNNPASATFFTTPNFITPAPQTTVGQVCFANYTPGPFPVQLVLSNSTLMPDPCAQTFSYTVTTPCLRPCPISVADISVCATDETLLVPMLGCSNLSCVTQVKWYVRSSPGTGPWILYQVTPGCSDLLLRPNQFTSDICVYAEVLTDGTCFCPQALSNIATVHLCEPISCSIQNPNPGLCYFNTPLSSGPLVLSTIPSSPTCSYTVQWYHNGLPISGATGPSYTPSNLVFQANALSECHYDYEYTAVISSPCGTQSCSTIIRVYDDNAPKGQLDMVPVEIQPFCPGEDATLVFTPGCAKGDPKMWDWYVRPCINGAPTYLPDAGNMNPLYNTNRLYNSVWYYVQTQNGVCPLDTVQLKIEVKDPLTILAFTAVPDACAEQQVDLTLDFAPCTVEGCGTACACTRTIEWYKDGNLIASTTWAAFTTSATFTYFGPAPFAGNYYAVLKDDCCTGSALTSPVVQIDPSCVPVIKGPCFICNGVPVILMGEMVIPPRGPCSTFCTYTWYELINGFPVFLGTGDTYLATYAGTYIFESDCNGCIKRDTFVLHACNNPCACGSLQWAQFWQQWSFQAPIACSNPLNPTPPLPAPCPKQGRDYFVIGNFPCNTGSCGNYIVSWELTRPGSLPPISGVSTIIYPFFAISLPWNQCVQPGIYTLKITRNCGVVPCTCILTFEVPNCGCLCADLIADVNQGFNVGTQINCKRAMKPYALDACDVVNWTVDGIPVGGTTTGNNNFFYDFAISGSYTVCMQVTRTPLVGAPCSYTKCQTVSVSCFGNPTGFCTTNALKNGNFTGGLAPGHLGGSGSVAEWLQFPNLDAGLVFVDDSAGGFDEGYLVLSGGPNQPAGIYQAVDLAQNAFTVIEYNRRNFSGDQLPDGTKLEFRLYADSNETSDNQLIFTDLIENSADTGWVARSASVQISTNPDYPYLVVSLSNDDPAGGQSVIGLDNLEMCTSATSDAWEPMKNQVFRLYPNPATNELTVEWSGYDGKNGSVQIFGSLGQILQTRSIPDGANSLTTNVNEMPEGIYFVKIVSAGRLLKVLKFVKL